MANRQKFSAGILILVCIAVVGGLLSILFQRFISVVPPAAVPAANKPTAAARRSTGPAIYNPPQPQDAPEKIREAVMLGYNILNETKKYTGDKVGNKLSCSNCHFKSGLTQGGLNGGLSLVGVGATYPKFRKRQNFAVHLVTRTNDCFRRSMNGTPLAEDSREMSAIIAYYTWISKGIAIYDNVPWLGVPEIDSDHTPDKVAGKAVFTTKCTICHGPSGEGTAAAPPLWGPQSFNDGAGMHKPETMAGFARYNMPQGNPDLTDEQALDVAAFVTSQPRPHFVNK